MNLNPTESKPISSGSWAHFVASPHPHHSPRKISMSTKNLAFVLRVTCRQSFKRYFVFLIYHLRSPFQPIPRHRGNRKGVEFKKLLQQKPSAYGYFPLLLDPVESQFYAKYNKLLLRLPPPPQLSFTPPTGKGFISE